jgi:hypothetical protein
MADIKQICAQLIELWDADCDADSDFRFAVKINELRALLANAELQIGVTLVIPEMTDAIEKAIEQRKPQPISVAERPWEREGWCDEQGLCWWLASEDPCWVFDDATTCRHWADFVLPANAIPAPRRGKD